jgi:hypothetical protein
MTGTTRPQVTGGACLVEMLITPDGHLLGRLDGRAGFDAFLGASEDLLRNVRGVAQVAGLDGDQVGYLG